MTNEISRRLQMLGSDYLAFDTSGLPYQFDQISDLSSHYVALFILFSHSLSEPMQKSNIKKKEQY